MPVIPELSTVADDEVVFHRGTEVRRYQGLEPDTDHDLDGVPVRTLPRRGELLATVATVNDVHFGEVECGVVEGTDIGPTFRSAPGDDPYPEVMNAGAIAEITDLGPAAVVVKGDLTGSGLAEEYQRFLEFYEPAFGERLHHVRGNHDSYHGGEYAAWPTQEVVLDGVILAILDTARRHQVNGSIDVEQAEWLDELASRADRPVMVFGHHPIWDPAVDERTDSTFGLRPDDSERLIAVFSRRPRLVGYFAGHTHRNHVVHIPDAGPAPFVDVACVKDYPGSWAEYRVFDGGILQIHRRISTPEALAWSEQCRHMYDGGYAAYALGSIESRCFEFAS